MSKTLKAAISLALLIVLVFTLSGCSFFSSMANHGRAAVTADAMAKSYIHDKYGFDAEVLGHDTQTTGALVQTVQTTVTVAMRYEGTEFCVYLDMDDPSCRYDNYQRDEVGPVLEEYLLKSCGLPDATYSSIDFDMGDDRAFIGRNVTITETGLAGTTSTMYDSSCMLNFKYEGQSGEELLDKITTINYTAAFSDPDKVLGKMTIPSHIADTYRADISMQLWNYEDLKNLESNVVDQDNLEGFECFNLESDDPNSVIQHGADEIRYYRIYWYSAKDKADDPDIDDAYVDFTP